MIEDSLAVEQDRPVGALLSWTAGGWPRVRDPLAEGDEWMAKVGKDEMVPYTLPTVYDNQPAMYSHAVSDERGGAVLRLVFGASRRGRLRGEGFNFQRGRGGVPHSFVQRDERA